MVIDKNNAEEAQMRQYAITTLKNMNNQKASVFLSVVLSKSTAINSDSTVVRKGINLNSPNYFSFLFRYFLM